MNLVLHLIGIVASVILTWGMFLPAIPFIKAVVTIALIAIVITIFAQLWRA